MQSASDPPRRDPAAALSRAAARPRAAPRPSHGPLAQGQLSAHGPLAPGLQASLLRLLLLGCAALLWLLPSL